jgi:polyphosphate kinase
MPRTLARRGEATIPVDDPELQARLWHILELDLGDDRQAWELKGERWARVRRGASTALGTQAVLMQEASERATGAP